MDIWVRYCCNISRVHPEFMCLGVTCGREKEKGSVYFYFYKILVFALVIFLFLLLSYIVLVLVRFLFLLLSSSAWEVFYFFFFFSLSPYIRMHAFGMEYLELPIFYIYHRFPALDLLATNHHLIYLYSHFMSYLPFPSDSICTFSSWRI